MVTVAMDNQKHFQIALKDTSMQTKKFLAEQC